MELRNRKHVHFIRAIKGKSVEIVPNMDSREGRPLKISSLQDIYEKETVQNNDDSLPKVQRRAVRSLLDTDKTVKSEQEVHEVDLAGKIDTCSDISSGDITLQQIRKQCKTTKRKRQGHTRRGDVTSDVTMKQECTTLLETEDDNQDLKETLRDVKSRLLKRRKGNEQTKSGTSSRKTKNLCNKGSLPISVDVKLEVCEIDYPDFETMARVSAISSGVELVAVKVTTVEVPVNREIESAVNEESHEPRDKVDPKSILDVTDREVVCSKSTSSLVENPLDQEFPVGESRYNGYGSNHVRVEEDISTLDYDIENVIPTSSCTKDVSWLTGNKNPIQKFDLDHITHGLLCLEMNSLETSCEAQDPTKNELPSNDEVIYANRLGSCGSSEDPCSSPGTDNCLPSVDEDCSGMEIQTVSSEHVDAKTNHKPICFYEAFGLFSPVADSDEIDQKQLQRPPERLLSGRKVISPSAQEKLCSAMNNPDSPEKKTNKCKGKLYFSGQNAHRILKAEGLDHIKRVEIAPNSKQINRKSNGHKQLFHQKGSPMVPHDDYKAPRFSTGRASIQCCSQKAIDFSQRQIWDAESVVTKLSNELKSMRDLMKEYLLSEASPSTSPKHNADQVKAAIRKAVKAEEAGIRQLAAMERDSNRFCKLMRLAQDGSAIATPEKAVSRKTKKITFADEAGGDLCHVKVFKNELESPPIYGQEILPTS